MKAKEAIEWINKVKGAYVNVDDFTARTRESAYKVFSDANKIIELLQRGEAYKQMWRELKENILNMEYCENTGINNIEQKYFPKPKGD